MKKNYINAMFLILLCLVFVIVGLLFFVLKNNTQLLSTSQSTTQSNPIDPKQFDTEVASTQIGKRGQYGFSDAYVNDKNTITAIGYKDLGEIQKLTLGSEKLDLIQQKPLEILKLGNINENDKDFYLRTQEESIVTVAENHLVKKNTNRDYEIYNIDDENLISTIPGNIKVVDESDKTQYLTQRYKELLSSSAFSIKSNLAAIQTEDEIRVYDLKSAQLKKTLKIDKLKPSKILEKLVADKNQDGFAFTFALIGGYDSKMEISPDGKKLASIRQEIDSVSGDSLTTKTVVDIYDLSSGNIETIYEKTSSRKPQSDVDKATRGIIKFNQNSNNLFFTLPEREVAIYNFNSKSFKEFKGANTLITAITIDKNSNILASGDADGFINIWDINQKKLISTIKAHNQSISVLEFSDESRSLLSLGSYDKKLSLWGKDLKQETNKELTSFLFNIQTSNEQNQNVYTDDLVFSKDSKKLYSTNYREEVQLWDLETQKKIWSYKNLENEVIGLSNDESKLVVVGPNEEVTVLNAATGQALNRKNLCYGQIPRVIAVNPNSESFVINCTDGLVLFDINNLEKIKSVAPDFRNGFGFSGDSKYFITDGDFDSDNIMEIYDGDFNLIKEIKEGDYNPSGLVTNDFLIASSISFSPDNSTIAAFSAREFLSLFNYKTYEKIGNLSLPESTDINSIAFHPNKKFLATGARNGGINIWNIESKTILQTLFYPGEIKKVLFSPDGSKMVVSGESGLIKVFEVNKI